MSAHNFDPVMPEIRAHAAQAAPHESCGVVIVRRGKLRYVPCRNDYAGADDTFVLNPSDYADAETLGAIVAIVHSHVFLSPEPSMADRVGIEATQVPWLIVNYPVGHYTVTEPAGYVAPMIGRPFVHGVLDCYSLIRDWYAQARAVALPDYERPEKWWEIPGFDLYRENFAAAGFEQIDERDMAPGDVILMQIAAPVTNHGGIYLGDNTILQHCMGRLSSRDVWGGPWRKAATHFLRYVGNPA